MNTILIFNIDVEFISPIMAQDCTTLVAGNLGSQIA